MMFPHPAAYAARTNPSFSSNFTATTKTRIATKALAFAVYGARLSPCSASRPRSAQTGRWKRLLYRFECPQISGSAFIELPASCGGHAQTRAPRRLVHGSWLLTFGVTTSSPGALPLVRLSFRGAQRRGICISFRALPLDSLDLSFRAACSRAKRGEGARNLQFRYFN